MVDLILRDNDYIYKMTSTIYTNHHDLRSHWTGIFYLHHHHQFHPQNHNNPRSQIHSKHQPNHSTLNHTSQPQCVRKTSSSTPAAHQAVRPSVLKEGLPETHALLHETPDTLQPMPRGRRERQGER